MNVRIPATCCVLFCLMMPLRMQAEDGEESETHSVRVQVLLVESNGKLDHDDRLRLSGPIEEVMDAVSDLTAQGKATIANHAELTVLEGQQTMLQVGETVAIRTGTVRTGTVRTGTVRTGSGRESNVYQDVSIGTLIKLTTEVVDNQVLIELDFSKSFVAPRGDDDQSERPQGTSQLTHQTTLRIKNGTAQMIGRIMSRESDDRSAAVQLIVSADILESSEMGQITRFRTNPRQPARSFSANSRFADRSSRGASSRTPPEEVLRRIATAMFDRADADQDGMISESELPRLSPRDDSAEPPIKKEQYQDWFSSHYPRSRSGGAPSSLGRRPSSLQPQARPQESQPKGEFDEESSVEGPESGDE
ncbi:hypothetical protein [Planctomycetes bacterium TBK1r]|uniref:Bacterial type II and III secretion system protein n=1 Tax=Stieleria magnilauensis TaxID=2527963 RepID=A0ABX5Y039_9BACT|nr:Bacterial type II and III secretion system protein [Planctomycetes bacterium TBK1r]